ncbi:hypothetical protein [Streptomyces flavofungini]|uniref:hypothetical protein n=1 Tax=Streptomyces flavofungini TaxID=68200 RepID=UPI0034DE378E
MRLDCSADQGGIEVAHHYAGPGARAVLDLAYRVARVVEEESGLTGHDFEVDQPTLTGDPRRAAARLGGVSDWVRRELVRASRADGCPIHLVENSNALGYGRPETACSDPCD